MTDDVLKETITSLAEPLATSLGLVIWGVEIVRAGRTVVRLFVDVPFPAESGTQPAPADTGDRDGVVLVARLALLGRRDLI